MIIDTKIDSNYVNASISTNIAGYLTAPQSSIVRQSDRQLQENALRTLISAWEQGNKEHVEEGFDFLPSDSTVQQSMIAFFSFVTQQGLDVWAVEAMAPRITLEILSDAGISIFVKKRGCISGHFIITRPGQTPKVIKTNA